MKRTFYGSLVAGAAVVLTLLAAACSKSEVEEGQIPVPANLQCSEATNNSLTFSWSSVNGATSYNYQQADSKDRLGDVKSTTSTTVTLTGLQEGTTLKLRVQAVAGSATSAWTELVAGTTKTTELPTLNKPEPATEVEAETTESSLKLTWTAVANAEKYAYQLKLKADNSLAKSGETTKNEVEITGLNAGTAYLFTFKATASGYNESAWSEAVEVSTAAAVTPEPPTTDVSFVWPNQEESESFVRAFPGAEGGGMYTTGGRGGEVIHVTKLTDDGSAGTLRHAINQNKARTIVFDVSGDIILKSDLKIQYGNLTIAGQTAPGDGICIRGGTVQFDNGKIDNVIIRYVRFRLGDESTFLSDGSDAFWGRYNKNIIIDHCSLSWSVDEVASFYANQNFTMQWCIIAESMKTSVHAKGNHGYGGIWGGKNASFHHNLLAHNQSRNARIDHPEIYGNYLSTHRGHVDYRNNVIYNWGDNSTYGGEGGWFNIVGNYYKPGPSSRDRKYFVDANGYYSSSSTQYDYPRLYVEGNVHTKYPELTTNQKAGIYLHDGTGKGDDANMFQSKLLAIKKDDQTTCYTTTHSAEDAFQQVVAYAGASHVRDAVDVRVTNDALTGTGSLIDSQSEVGGWAQLKATEEQLAQVVDTDGDGIPDYYEQLFGLDPNDKTDGNKITLDKTGRYTNLEMYFHYLVQEKIAAQVSGGTNIALN